MDNEIYNTLIANKEVFIGGKIKDYGDQDGPIPLEATIIDIRLTGNYFSVDGEPFSCGCDLSHLHITHNPEFAMEIDGIAFIGYGGHEWHIYPKENRE